MTIHFRVVFASCAVAIITVVNTIAVTLGPHHVRLMLLFCGVLALVAAVQCATWDPALLTWALVFSLPPVIALVSDGSPTWLIGPLGALLLVAGELNALSWECNHAGPIDAMIRRRVLNVCQLGALGLGASLAVGLVGLGPSIGGTAAVVVAATALAAFGWVVFGRGI